MRKRFDLRMVHTFLELNGLTLLFDTNVWLILHGPFLDFRSARYLQYSRIMDAARTNRQPILICQCIVSEYFHVYLNERRQEAGIGLSDGFPAGKRFRKTEIYTSILRDIGDDIFHILSCSTQVSDSFNKLDVDRCLKECESGHLDFNDVMIRETCRNYDAVLVTDDADFADADIPIASANRRFFP